MKIPLRYVCEMVCDRVAASQIYLGDKYTDASPWEGFLIEICGKRIYFAGDTGLMADMVLLAGEEIDAALLPIGDRYTMGPEDAVRAAEMIQPRLVIPMHYDTFPTIEQDPQAFRRLAEEKTGIPVAVLKPGEAIML